MKSAMAFRYVGNASISGDVAAYINGWQCELVGACFLLSSGLLNGV
jgi:hypothetical protein